MLDRVAPALAVWCLGNLEKAGTAEADQVVADCLDGFLAACDIAQDE
jgi:hypothetical protein